MVVVGLSNNLLFKSILGQREASYTEDTKDQLNSEWIYEVIVSPKMPTKNVKDFCPTLLPGQKSLKFLVGILGETMTL